MSEGGENSPPSFYQPITGWHTKSLGKTDLHVCGSVFPTLVQEGGENAHGWVITQAT